ncbi:MAG TPA: SIS domain-containing protein, partial [Roseiflexaceae bacterium]|nr:SIS domain-containing protein [Roseiflexaceae bacterium]
MSTPGQHTLAEIQSQPAAWVATLETLRAHADMLAGVARAEPYDAVAFTGCGSPYYLALAAAALLQELSGRPARAVPASELWLNPRAALPTGGRTLLVALSRSGETTELLRAVQAFRAAGRGRVLTLTSYPGRPLEALGDWHLTLPAGQEQSLAQTRAFTTLQLAATTCAALWSGRTDLLESLAALPGACQRLLSSHGAAVRALGRDASIDRFYFLGSGPRYGLAAELSLKMKEMSLSHSEPFHVLEFRHGPKSMATAGALVVGLIAESSAAHELAVLADVRAQGARTLALGEVAPDVPFASGLPEAVAG